MQNFEQIILLLISGQGMILSIALLSFLFKKKYSTFFLGLITRVVTLEILNIWGMRVSYHSLKTAFPYWLFGSYLIIPPALWLFVKSNTQPIFHLKPKSFILFVPALVEITIEFLSFYFYKLLAVNFHLTENQFWFTFTEILPVISMVMVLVFFAKELNKLKIKQKQLPKTKNNSFYFFKLYTFFVFFSLLTLFWLLATLFNFKVYYIIEIGLITFLFLLGYIGIFQPSFFDVPKVLTVDTLSQKFSHFDDKKELKRLKALFEDEKIFTKQKLALKDVAIQLNLPERYVSRLINLHLNSSFITYVNSFRVTYALKQIKNPSERNKTLLGIAMDSGFNSKSSFNKVFKSMTGKKPSDFLSS
jgi:AraC-like DNA-binding protein